MCLRKPEGPEYFGEDGGGSGPFINPLRGGTSWVVWDPRVAVCVWVWLGGAGWWRQGRGRGTNWEESTCRNCRGLHTVLRTNEGLCCCAYLCLSRWWTLWRPLWGERGGENETQQEQDDQGQRMESGSLCLERRTKADARSRLFPARSNPWGEFGIGGPRLGGRANGQLGMEIQNTTRPHDWSCILMKGDRQGPHKVLGAHTHTHTHTEGGRAKWVGGTLEDGREHGRGIHRGKRGASGCGPPPFWPAGASQTTRLWWGPLQQRERPISGAAWAGRSLARQASPGLLAVFSKNRRTRYCRPKPSNRPCPPRRNAGLSTRHTVPDAPQFQ